MASFVLGLYVVLRVGDLWWRGQLTRQVMVSWQGGLFVFEMLVSAVIPALLLSIRRVRLNIAGLATCSAMTVLGIIGYRFDTCIIAFLRPANMPYFPTWTEVAISAGIISAAGLVFIFLNENLRIMPHEQTRGADAPAGPATQPAEPPAFDEPFLFTAERRRYSLGLIVAGALAIGLLPQNAIFGPRPERVPAYPSRSVEALAVKVNSPQRELFHIASLAGRVPAALHPKPLTVRLIDGNRNWRFVPFTHDEHAARLGGPDSCNICHHQNVPFEQTSGCYKCHRDMY
jgi:hypothetical protein